VHPIVAEPPAVPDRSTPGWSEWLGAIPLEDRLQLAQRLLVPELDLRRFVEGGAI
jgi:hypothetical protein